jgi:hypothetical protein
LEGRFYVVAGLGADKLYAEEVCGAVCSWEDTWINTQEETSLHRLIFWQTTNYGIGAAHEQG